MIAFSAFSELPAMFFSQRISKIIRRPNTILLAYTFTTIAYIGYLLVGTPNVLPIFSISKGIGYGLNLTMSIVMLTGLTPEEWSAASQSLMTISWMGLAPLVAGPLGGIILDAFSIRAVYGLGLVAVFIAAIIILSASKRGELS
jgi:MFS family permease